MKPILLVPDAALLPTVTAGAARAGRQPRVAVLRAVSDLEAILERGTDAEILIACLADHRPLTLAALRLVGLGARPVPVLMAASGIGVEPACVAWLHELPAELNVAVPSVEDEAERRRLWGSLRDGDLDERHHLIEVDGQPALAEMAARGVAFDGDVVRGLAAGAAGVLGGRMVWNDRRWSAALHD